jgi:hypothetical protein
MTALSDPAEILDPEKLAAEDSPSPADDAAGDSWMEF